MSSKLQDEIRQTIPFQCVREELALNLSRTAAMLSHEMEQGLRGYGLSATQYNVLRILRGAGAAGLCQYEVADRLVAQVPDVPRILNRMEKAGWVQRTRGVLDRRVVTATLTERGQRLVGDLDAPMEQLLQSMFTVMTEAEMTTMNELLVAARTRA